MIDIQRKIARDIQEEHSRQNMYNYLRLVQQDIQKHLLAELLQDTFKKLTKAVNNTLIFPMFD